MDIAYILNSKHHSLEYEKYAVCALLVIDYLLSLTMLFVACGICTCQWWKQTAVEQLQHWHVLMPKATNINVIKRKQKINADGHCIDSRWVLHMKLSATIQQQCNKYAAPEAWLVTVQSYACYHCGFCCLQLNEASLEQSNVNMSTCPSDASSGCRKRMPQW